MRWIFKSIVVIGGAVILTKCPDFESLGWLMIGAGLFLT